jgi:hypothetical protein
MIDWLLNDHSFFIRTWRVQMSVQQDHQIITAQEFILVCVLAKTECLYRNKTCSSIQLFVTKDSIATYNN